MAFGRRLIGKRQREQRCKCCRYPHAGRPTDRAPFVADENNILLADHLVCGGGLLGLIEQMQAANLTDPTIGMRTKKLKRVVAKQVAAFAKARAQEVAQSHQSRSDRRQVNRAQHVAPLEREELVLGKLLGVGGFSHVYEIKSFDLSATTTSGTSSGIRGESSSSSGSVSSSIVSCERLLRHSYTKEQRVARTFLSHHAVRSQDNKKKHEQSDHHREQQNERGEAKEPEAAIDMSDRTMTLTVDITTCNNRPRESEAKKVIEGMPSSDHGDDNMCRYAVKHLKPNLLNNPEKFAKAAMDLASEAQVLLCLDHPNIVKLRGLPARGPSVYKSGEHNAYFLVIDRLVETLQDRVYMWRRHWKKIHRKAQPRNQRSPSRTGIVGRFQNFFRGAAYDNGRTRTKHRLQRQSSSRSKPVASQSEESDDALSSDSITKHAVAAGDPHHTKELGKAYLERELNALLVERLQVAHDTACALEYLHEKGIIYRDLKTANVGFDIRGNVKLYDFGLSRYLPTSSGGDPDEAYIMSNVGTPRYTAPEVSTNRPYNLKADVYSFGVVLWEILSMNSPQEGGRTCPMTGAVIEPKHPKACPCWPVELQNLVTRMLNPDYPKRPTMTHVRSSIEEIIRTLSDPESSMDMLEFTGDGAARLFMSRRRRSTFRVESFNMEELVGLKDLDAATATAEEDSSATVLVNDRSLSSSFGASIISSQDD